VLLGANQLFPFAAPLPLIFCVQTLLVPLTATPSDVDPWPGMLRKTIYAHVSGGRRLVRPPLFFLFALQPPNTMGGFVFLFCPSPVCYWIPFFFFLTRQAKTPLVSGPQNGFAITSRSRILQTNEFSAYFCSAASCPRVTFSV